MFIGIAINLTGRLMSSASPAALFANGEPGAWYDFSDLTTLFQDSVGTTPVTAPNQTVGLMLDKSQGLVLGSELRGNGAIGSFGTAPAPATYNTTTGVGTASRTNSANQSFVSLPATTGLTYSITVQNTGSVGAFLFTGSAIGGLGASAGIIAAGQTVSFNAATVSNGFCVASTVAGAANFTVSSVKLLAGNHATQATAGQRPTYGVNPITGTRNLLVQTEAVSTFSGQTAGGTVASSTAVSVPSGIGATSLISFTEDTANSLHYCAAFYTITETANSVGSAYVKAAGRTRIKFGVGGGFAVQAQFDLSTGQFVGGANGVTAVSAGNGWYRLSRVNAAGTGISINIFAADDTGATTYTGNGAVAFYATAAQFEENMSQVATAYQKVVTQYEVTEAGVQSASYISFDGTDDSMVTGTITPSIDKAQVFAGVRKLSDAVAILAEFSPTVNSNIGSFLFISGTNNVTGFELTSRGTAVPSLGTTGRFAVSAPITVVATGIGDISAPLARMRVNGVTGTDGTSTQGTGNYLAYPLYIGRRGGTSNPFNGRIYSLIVRFGANLTTGQITSTESWVNSKTGGF